MGNISTNIADGSSYSNQKKINLKKLEEEYCKTLEQVCSPNSSTLNLENLKKTQSLHYMKAMSGANSPQQVKSKSSLGTHCQGGAYNNMHSSQPQRSSYSKSQVGNRCKTASRKKRNLYTSMGNYYSSTGANPPQQVNLPSSNNSASRTNKKMQTNFLENLEKANFLVNTNLNSANAQKKRNKSVNKSYNTNEHLDGDVQMNNYINASTNMSQLNNKQIIIENPAYNSNNNSLVKNLDNSF